MRARLRHVTAGAIASLLAIAGDAAAPLDKGEALPPFTRAYMPTSVDERGSWMIADEGERGFRDARAVVRDEALNRYVRGVLCNTVGEDRCGSVRIYIVRLPDFNAGMAPNGMLIVNTGLLLRARSAAELGAVLGHEFAHFELRHSLSAFRKRRSGGDLMAWAAVLANINPDFARLNRDIRYDTVGGFFAFDRAQERDADMLGLRYLAASDYPGLAAARVWERQMAEADASAIGRKRPTGQKALSGFFDTHPTDLQRAVYLRTAAGSADADDPDGAAAHRAAIAAWVPGWLTDQTKLGDFGGSEFILASLAEDAGWTAPLSFARAEMYRERGHPRDLATAAELYRDAIGAGGAPAEAHRGLGLSLIRAGEVEAGRAALRDYLAQRPEAADAAVIASLLAS